MAAGLDRPTQPRRNAVIFMEYTDGWTTAELANEYGLAASTIHVIVKGVIKVICLTTSTTKPDKISETWNSKLWNKRANKLYTKMLRD